MIKKRYIATFLIPLSLAAIAAAILTPTPERAFLSKLDNYQKAENVYSEVVYNVAGEKSVKVEQYKVDGEYYAKYYSFEKIPLVVNTKAENVLFGNDFLASSASKLRSQEENSLFWLDKITSDNIQKGSVKRDKTAKEGYIYTANLDSETPIRVTFFNGLLKKIEYFDVEYSSQIVNVFPDFGKGKRVNIVVEVSDYKTQASLTDDFIISERANVITLRELRETMSNDLEEDEEDENIFSQIKSAIEELQESFEDDETYEEERSGTIKFRENGAFEFNEGEKFRIMQPEDF